MRVKKCFIPVLILLVWLVPVSAEEIAGAYYGEVEESTFMVMLQKISPNHYSFNLYELWDESPPLLLEEKDEGVWYVPDEPNDIDIFFFEDRCLFYNTALYDEMEFFRLTGSGEEAAGEYLFPESGPRSQMLLSITDTDGRREMKMLEWGTLDSALIADEGRKETDDPLQFAGDEYSYSLKIDETGEGELFVEEEGMGLPVRRDNSRPLYETYQPVPPEGIAGAYRGDGGEVEIMILVNSIGQELYGFDLLSQDDVTLFAASQWEIGAESRQAVYDDVILTLIGDEAVLEIKDEGEILNFQSLLPYREGKGGMYLMDDREEGYALVLDIREQGEYVHLKIVSWYMEIYFDARETTDQLYTAGEEWDQILLAFAGDSCRIIIEGELFKIGKIGVGDSSEEEAGFDGSMKDTSAAGRVSAGFIPDLSTPGAVEERLAEYRQKGSELFRDRGASELQINLRKTTAVSLQGLNPVSVSPDGRFLFAAGPREIGVYNIETGIYFFREAVNTGNLDFPAVRWAPDSSKVVYCEDFYRMMLDADLHLIYTEPYEMRGAWEHPTDDGIDILSFSGDSANSDIPLFWTDDSSEIVFLRNRLSDGMTFRKYNTMSREIESLSPSLDFMNSIVNAFPDRNSGRVYYSTVSSSSEPQQGIMYISPEESRPVELTKTAAPEGAAQLADLSLDGRWLLVHYPANTFALYSVADDSIMPLLSELTEEEHSPMIINNAVFSPDGSKILLVYGAREERERFIAVSDTGSGEVHTLYTIKDPTAGVSPQMTRSSGVVGLAWSLDDSLFVNVDFGRKGLILRP